MAIYCCNSRYPDMLQVGNPLLTFEENCAHFGSWCVISAPLYLGFDLGTAVVLLATLCFC